MERLAYATTFALEAEATFRPNEESIRKLRAEDEERKQAQRELDLVWAELRARWD